jgi:hypothetical protein
MDDLRLPFRHVGRMLSTVIGESCVRPSGFFDAARQAGAGR